MLLVNSLSIFIILSQISLNLIKIKIPPKHFFFWEKHTMDSFYLLLFALLAMDCTGDTINNKLVGCPTV